MSNCCKTTTTTATTTKLTIALCGNPNSGKTTLFNALTGSNQKVGNWPGVTVEQKLGTYKKDNSVAIVDTPGIYSLSPFTIDEQVAHNYLMEGKPDLIINIVDSTNLERNLFLTSQLMELDVPVVVALNMQDEAKAKGIHINKDMLEEYFGCAFFAISAAKNQGIDQLMAYCIAGNYQSKNHFVYSDAVENAIKALQPLTDHADNGRWTSLKLAEKDKTIIKMLNLDESQKQLVSTTHQTLKEQLGDIVSAGGSSDSTVGLAALLSRPDLRPACVTVMDAKTVAKALEVGIGNRGDFVASGKENHGFNGPVPFSATVLFNSDAKIAPQSNSEKGMEFDMGMRVTLKTDDDLYIIVSEYPNYNHDAAMMTSMHVDPRDMRIIMQKTHQMFKEGYRGIMGSALYADTEGFTDRNIPRLPFKSVRRPLYPLDEISGTPIENPLAPTKRPCWLKRLFGR